MNRRDVPQPEVGKALDTRVKRQTFVVLCIGLFMGSLLVFTVVWSGTKQAIEEQKMEAAKKNEQVIEGSKAAGEGQVKPQL